MLTPTPRHKSSFTIDERRRMRGTIRMKGGMAKTSRRPHMLVATFNRVAFVGPIRAEVVGQIENFHIGKAHRTQFCICWSEVRAMVQGTTAAIQHNELLARERIHSILQLLDSRRLRALPSILRTWDMRCE